MLGYMSHENLAVIWGSGNRNYNAVGAEMLRTAQECINEKRGAELNPRNAAPRPNDRYTRARVARSYASHVSVAHVGASEESWVRTSLGLDSSSRKIQIFEQVMVSSPRVKAVSLVMFEFTHPSILLLDQRSFDTNDAQCDHCIVLRLSSGSLDRQCAYHPVMPLPCIDFEPTSVCRPYR